jgi:hypothetical protein
MRDESSTQGSIQTPRFRTEKGCTSFPEQTQILSQNQHGLLIQGVYRWVFSEPDTGFSNHKDARRFSVGVGFVVLSRAPYVFRHSGRMEEEPFSQLTLAVLFACIRVDTCHS